MSINILSFLASVAYLSTGSLQYYTSFRKLAIEKYIVLAGGMLAAALHTYILYRWIDTPIGQNLSLSHMFSLVCWLMSITIIGISWVKPIQNLYTLIFPISAFSIILSVLFPGYDIFKTIDHPKSMVHIFVSILALGTLGLAALQALLIYLQNSLLKRKSSFGINALPPLQTMESFLFQIIWLGFLLLSASLTSAFLLVDEGFFNARVQQIILSVLAWSFFATLLYKHHLSGLRGLKAIQWTLFGVFLLIGAYLTGKLVRTGFIN